MAQLNNRTTGEIIRIDKVKENRIYYTVFENSIYLNQNLFGKEKWVITWDRTYIPSQIQPIGDTIDEAVFAKIIETEVGFEVSEDTRNWFIEIGSTGGETLLRLFIPDEAYDNALRDKNKDGQEGRELGLYYPLWAVISFGTENIDAKYAQITRNSTVLYLLELLPEHRAVIEMYANDGVIIEEKYPVVIEEQIIE